MDCSMHQEKTMTIRVTEVIDQEVVICRDNVRMEGILSVPEYPKGIVLFAHGAGSHRFSPRNLHVAESLLDSGFATLLVNLLTQQEQRRDAVTGKLRNNIPLIAGRIDLATEWIEEQPRLASLSLAYFGSGIGAAAAAVSAVQRPLSVRALICRGGRLDLVPQVAADLRAPTLMLVGERDEPVLRGSLTVTRRMQCEKKLIVIPGASHLFEEPGKLDEVARYAFLWLREHL